MRGSHIPHVIGTTSDLSSMTTLPVYWSLMLMSKYTFGFVRFFFAAGSVVVCDRRVGGWNGWMEEWNGWMGGWVGGWVKRVDR